MREPLLVKSLPGREVLKATILHNRGVLLHTSGPLRGVARGRLGSTLGCWEHREGVSCLEDAIHPHQART